jgi:predicted TIM-barrel fold metal-dependent hydrolase
VPQLKLVAAHLGGWERWSEVLEHLAGLPVYLDTSYSLPFCPKPILKELFNRHSADYIVFGSDSPWVDQKKELQAVRQLPLTSDQLEKILWHNTRRLLGF